MRPYIQIIPYAINSSLDNFEEDSAAVPLFNVIVSQGKLKMMFLVANHNPIDYPDTREYETVRCEYVTLHGQTERDKYLTATDDVKISADCTIVNEIFETSLKDYGIKLLSATFHNFEFFETEIEGKGFVFEDKEKYNNLKDLINEKFKVMMKVSNIMQY